MGWCAADSDTGEDETALVRSCTLGAPRVLTLVLESASNAAARASLRPEIEALDAES